VQTGLGTVNSVITGTIQMWPTTSAPSGYLLCDGTAVSRTTYATLFGVVGTTFGTGDGSTTFNLPNYVDKMPIGKGTIAASIGATGGSSTTTLTTSNLPAHSHTATVTDPGHTHPPPSGYNFAGYGPPGNSSGPNNTFSAFSQTGSAVTGVSVSIANTGSGTAATTISPYLGINFIIKT
jgi:microcystin-dependent protein